MNTISKLIKSGEATIVDVRSISEYSGGHIAGSINIPLQEIPDHLGEIKQMKNIILCCASGNRSAQATKYLKQNGIECENGGSWLDLNDCN